MPVLTRALVGTCLLATLALADDAADKALALNKEGTRLAEQGRFADAIARFKSAEALLPRYQHHCNIGIAYQDSGQLPQALLFLQSCVARAGKNASPALKGRLAKLEVQLNGALWGTLVVTGERLRVAVAPWADEEWVVDGQRTFVLEAGSTSLLVRSAEGVSWTQPATVEAGASTKLTLVPPPPPPVVAAAPPEPAPQPKSFVASPLAPAPPRAAETATTITTPAAAPSRRIAPWLVAGTGAVLLAVGTGTYFAAAGQASSFTATTPEAGLGGYRALVVTTYSSWGLGAVALVGGLVWGLVAGPSTPVALMPAVGPRGEVTLALGARL